ncbi:leucine-rich repeat-containing protein 70 [Latimeria chalumnae]|uniref:Leucine rich repeat containing 70 n=1 Tax=Latimeria chalumnae TaxID=7897 RepID=H3AKJ5_LATCH|nr:PREDICTED: leucine-rich repeat-containing protein 70 [Latimeria chalumnae]|eukprot:XP_006007783.1 PREDICTED: leucine-rich repeat-containing protein 70 [Latimeria chalumnae]
MHGFHSSKSYLQEFLFLLLNCFFIVLLLQDHALGCSSGCQQSSRSRVQCRDLGLTYIPKNCPKSSTLLYLSGNNISYISSNDLRGLYKLSVLYLDNNGLVYIHPKAFADLKKLNFLYLNHNRIEHLDSGIFEDLLDLHYLYLQHNQIAFLPKRLFIDLVALRYLLLQKNLITVLGSGSFFGMTNLHTLNLASNRITRISSSALSQLENLKYLHLEGNNLIQIPSNAFGGLKNLKRLVLSSNPIEIIHPFAFKGLENLEYLFLENAKVKAIDKNGFAYLSNLKQLMLGHNKLHSISSNPFSPLRQLRYLQLDKNNLISIEDDTFKGLAASLKTLSLANNSLTSLHPKVLQPLVSLNYLHLSYNPWDCNCQLFALRTWLTISSLMVTIRCSNPPKLHGKSLAYVSLREFENCVTVAPVVKPALDLETLDVHRNKIVREMSRLEVATVEMNSMDLESIFTKTSESIKNVQRFTNEKYISVEQVHYATMLPLLIPVQRIPVNLTTYVEDGFTSPAATSVSLKPLKVCEQHLAKLNQVFDILLVFFILACVVVLVLIFKVFQLKQKLNTGELAGENILEYYSVYQSAQYSVTDPVQPSHVNPQFQGHTASPPADPIRTLKQAEAENQAQVILFEHSVL